MSFRIIGGIDSKEFAWGIGVGGGGGVGRHSFEPVGFAKTLAMQEKIVVNIIYLLQSQALSTL